MKGTILIKEGASLDKLLNAAAGSFATLSSIIVGGVSLVMVGHGHYEYIPNLVAMTPTLYITGQYFYMSR